MQNTMGATMTDVYLARLTPEDEPLIPELPLSAQGIINAQVGGVELPAESAAASFHSLRCDLACQASQRLNFTA